MASNRFTNLRRAKPAGNNLSPVTGTNEPEPPSKKVATAKRAVGSDTPLSAESGGVSANQIVEPEQVRRGRPRAKRSDAGFAQATAYIRKDTYTAVRHLLLDQRKEYSVLVQELLEKWLKEHQQ